MEISLEEKQIANCILFATHPTRGEPCDFAECVPCDDSEDDHIVDEYVFKETQLSQSSPESRDCRCGEDCSLCALVEAYPHGSCIVPAGPYHRAHLCHECFHGQSMALRSETLPMNYDEVAARKVARDPVRAHPSTRSTLMTGCDPLKDSDLLLYYQNSIFVEMT